MPIAFARLEFVKRSVGKNSCAKAAYNSRCEVHFKGTEWQEARTYNWSKGNPPVYHEILLSNGVDPKFQLPEVLWNAVEQKELRRNSQTALEMVLALPDDKVITLEDRKYLARSFVEMHFVKNGLAAQIDIHAPETKQVLSDKDGYETIDHNWHAHVLVTTRRFKENGIELDDHKARDLMPDVRGKKVISGEHWGKLWAQHQNIFFEQKGLELRVDSEGVVGQKHIGPVRMRGRAFSLLEENELRMNLNTLESNDPKNVLEKVTQTKNIFTTEDVDNFLHKHVDPKKVSEIRESFWKQEGIVQLLDRNSFKPLNKFTTESIISEEKQITRLADKLSKQNAFSLNEKKSTKFTEKLTEEQKAAFNQILSGKKLCCIEGHAGTGKSYLLGAIKDAYESKNYTVRGFGPDSATSEVLKEKGFKDADNIYRFLFSVHHGKKEINKNKEVWILDEASKLGTKPLLEFLKYANRFGAQVVLSGNSAQLPSVERGMGFKFFSERYQTHYLADIQRQKDQIQREIAKKLAIGEMGQALDEIHRLGEIKWRSSKEETMESLIKAWALNRKENPNEKTLIIAHANKEIKVLNEFARLYRKEVGELPGKEYLCETAYGKIYVSCGDPIEFRQNDKDLGVKNGMKGILIKASESRFVVQMRDENTVRNITFNPQQYRKFQLGYASTLHHSQGKTVDKAYVYHSPVMNKEMFYVGFTRHIKKAEFYVCEQDAKYLSDLKRQAYRQTFKASTLDYLNQKDLEKQQSETLKKQSINELKSSDSIFAKMKGMGLSTWEEVRSATGKIVDNYRDKKPDQEFFNPKIEKDQKLGNVKEVIDFRFEEENKIDRKKLATDFQKLKVEEKKVPRKKIKESWKELTEEKRSILREYFKSSDKAASLYTIVKSENDHSLKESPHFADWQKACAERNSHAYEVNLSFKIGEIRSILGTKGHEILKERAAKHEIQLQRKDNPQIDLDAKLKENLDFLLHRLFPEGPTKRDNRGFRFGSKGSLAVTCTGDKIGCFFDFERNEGGGPIQLIQRALGCSNVEAVSWAKDFLGQSPNIQVPTHFVSNNKGNDQEWISIKPDQKNIAPSLKEISKGLTIHYKEIARYTYRDAEGNALFHTLRLEDEQGKKIVLPLTYGYYKGNEEEPCWSLKGYQADKKPLYNLHLLKEFPQSKVLIVEGEKTADAASKMFPKEKMICLTWSGGAGAVNKSHWTPLFMREVIIWPDNDKAGFEASDSICKELRQIGIKSLHEVNREILAKELPPKWDLADALPQGKEKGFVKDQILRAQEKAVGVASLVAYLKANSIQVGIKIALQVLSRIEERMRPLLEEKFGHKNGEIKSVLLTEMSEIFKDASRLKGMLGRSNFSVSAGKEDKLMNLYEIENRDVTTEKLSNSLESRL